MRSPITGHECFKGLECDLWYRKSNVSITCSSSGKMLAPMEVSPQCPTCSSRSVQGLRTAWQAMQSEGSLGFVYNLQEWKCITCGTSFWLEQSA